MANEINIYEPRYLAAVVETAPPLYTFLRDTFFTNIVTFASERVDIDIVKGNRRMAAFVHPKAGGGLLSKEGYETKSYAPPLVNALDVTYADQLMTRMAGESLYSKMTPAQRAAKALMKDYKRLNDAVTRREEWMAAQVLSTGTLTVSGKGVNETIDFGLTNKVTLSGKNVWGGTSADIVGNLRDWKEQIRINGFANADMLIMGADAAKLFMADTNVKETLNNRRFFMGEIKPAELPNGVELIGYWSDPALKLYRYDEVYLDDWTNPAAPETKPLIAKNQVIMISSNIGFMRAYGAVTHVKDNGQWVTEETARYLGSYVEHNPDRRMLEVQAHPLLIPDKVDSWLVATVC